MKTLNTYINEWQLNNKSKHNINALKIVPKTFYELRKIAKDRYYKNRESIDMSDIDISKITNLGDTDPSSSDGVFYGFEDVQTINIVGWNSEHIQSFGHLFQGCNNLTSIIGIESLNTKNVKCMFGTFGGCFSLKTLDLSHWDMSNVSVFNSMFYNCYNLKTLKGIEKFKGKVVFDDTFHNCSKLDTSMIR